MLILIPAKNVLQYQYSHAWIMATLRCTAFRRESCSVCNVCKTAQPASFVVPEKMSRLLLCFNVCVGCQFVCAQPTKCSSVCIRDEWSGTGLSGGVTQPTTSESAINEPRLFVFIIFTGFADGHVWRSSTCSGR